MVGSSCFMLLNIDRERAHPPTHTEKQGTNILRLETAQHKLYVHVLVPLKSQHAEHTNTFKKEARP
jgi:hypothetical protein